jgi:hypothetical protein
MNLLVREPPPNRATDSCPPAASCRLERQLDFFSAPRGIFQRLRDVLIFEIRIQLQNLRARVAGGDETGDRSRRDAQSANASASAHDIRIQSDSIQHFHGNNLTVLQRESNFSFVEQKKSAHFNKIDVDFNFIELYKAKEQFNFIK